MDKEIYISYTRIPVVRSGCYYNSGRWDAAGCIGTLNVGASGPVGMTDEPVGYDREWTTSAGHRARQRLGYSHERGELTRFVIQLEYRLDEEWATVVRYDHDLDGEMAHDVTEEGLHIDIYRDGEKHATEYITGPIPAGVALDLAEDHLSKNTERFIRRFEAWHTE